MDSDKGAKKEELQRVHRKLEEKKEDFLIYSSRSMEDLENADFDMLKRSRNLDELRSICGTEDTKLEGLINEQQNLLCSMRKKRMERIEDLEYFAKEKIKDIEVEQDEILYEIEKEDTKRQDKE